MFYVGGNLLSHTLPGAVPSARAGLASGFGMGNRAFPCRYFHRQTCGTPNLVLRVLCQILHSGRVTHTWCVLFFVTALQNKYFSRYMALTKPKFGVLVCRCISTSSLNISHCLQVWPINPIVCREPQQKPHLKTGFPLRCFQRLSLPYVANQPCSWRNNWHTRGTSVPVLSY